MQRDVRWEQRFANYNKALKKLSESVQFIHSYLRENETKDVVLVEIIKEGLIQRFEYTHELAWNVMKDYAAYQGNNDLFGGSKDATRYAFSVGLIENGHVWMDMISSRNQTSHMYDQHTADEIYIKILGEYYAAFIAFQKSMEAKKSNQQADLL